MKTPEGLEKDHICKFLFRFPDIWFVRNTTWGYGKSGLPDIIGCYRTRLFAIEVKRPGAEPTRLQHLRMQYIYKSGGKVFWGDAKKVIEGFNKWTSSLPQITLSSTTATMTGPLPLE
jgi:hypothetical protein